MTEINKIIVDMLNGNQSNVNMKGLASNLGMSEKQLFVRLKQIINYGYKLEPSYCYNSDIYYKIVKEEICNNNSVRIKISSSEKVFRCIVISDIHIGHVNSNVNLLKRVYEYAAKENIHIILNCGDLIEGVHTTAKTNIKDIYEQLEILIKKYPYDRNINNFVVFGNHDYHSLYYDNLDISKTIANARYDIVPIGFGKGIVNLKNDKLLLEHTLSVSPDPELGDDTKISLVGHGHMMKTKTYDKLYICIPSLSLVSPDVTIDIIPGFVDLEINFEGGIFEFVKAKHMIIGDKIYQASESRCRIKELYKSIGR